MKQLKKMKKELIKKINKETLASLKEKYNVPRNILIHYLQEAVEKGALSPAEYKSFIFRSIYKKIIKRERKFPDKIENKLEAVLSSINAEPKQVILTLLDEYPLPVSTLKSLYNYITSEVWEINYSTINAYFNYTFLPIGAVVEENIIFDDLGREITGWRLNEGGKKYVKPIARFCLKKANEYEISFYEIFGATHSGGNSRAPLNTARVLKHLLKKGESRLADMEKIYHTYTAVISYTLHRLKKVGLVEGESVGSEEPWQIYEWVKGNPHEVVKSVHSKKTLREGVAEIIYKSKIANINEIREGLKNYGYEKVEKGTLSSVLTYLTKLGFIRRRTEFIGREKHSSYRLTYKGKEFTKDVIERIENALQDGNELKYMHELCKDIFKPSYIEDCGYGVLLYEEIAPPLKRKSFEERVEEVKRIIEETPGIRPKEIEEITGICPIPHLSYLLKTGEIYKEKIGKSVRYYPIN